MSGFTDPGRRFWRAVNHGNAGVARELLQAGVDPDTPSARPGNTGAGGTAGRTDVALEIARLLLEHGADPRATDAKGRTILEATRTPAMHELVESHL